MFSGCGWRRFRRERRDSGEEVCVCFLSQVAWNEITAPFRSFEIIVEQYPIVGIALHCQVAGPLLQNSGLHRFQSFSFHDDILLLSLHMFC